MRLEFNHEYGVGKVSPATKSGFVLTVLANIPLGRLEAGYDARNIQRLEADAQRFARENDIDYVDFAQGVVNAPRS
jgi:hypothetical protein